MDLARGMSLRKKRSVKPKTPKISAPIQAGQQRGPALPAISENGSARPRLPGPTSSSSSLNVPRARGQGQASTADYVKRRYSTRINLPTDFGDAPALPSLPGEFLAQPPAKSPGRSASSTGEKIAVDLKTLQDPSLQADQYVAHLLANATESDIANYQADLTKIKNRTSTDLQHNVYQNREQFIKISREADRLKSEMRSLRNLMSDLTSTLGQTNAALGIDTQTVSSSSRKYANRSSVANLEAMWSTHLQELWRRVEGSQKYLPAIPGRHVVHESGRWVELNTATFKTRRRVHLILLNDHLLVAVEKSKSDNRSASPDPSSTLSPKKAQQGPTAYVAERCLPLQDVELTDLGMKPSIPGAAHGSIRRASRQPNTNAINIRIGQDSFTYACTDQDGTEKSSFLAKFRKAVSDLRKTQQADLDNDPNSLGIPGISTRSKSRSPAGREKQPNGLSSPSVGGPDSSITKNNMLIEADGRQQSFQWMEQQVDELDIDVALQRYSNAVQRIEDLRRIAARNKSNSTVQELVGGKVAIRASKLAKGITRELVEKAAWASATKHNVALLQRLGFEQQASASFLESRSEVVRTRVSQCADTGDLGGYLFQLAWVTFTLVRNTIRVYQGSFSQGMGSAVVKWAKEHVEGFNRVLERQVGRLERGGEEKKRVMEGVRNASELLAEVGVDLGGLVGRGLEE